MTFDARVFQLLLLLILAGTGCASRQAPLAAASLATLPVGLNDRVVMPVVEAACVPPTGWVIQPLKQTNNHVHQVWLSPTGNTAYGVIRFSLPLPVGPDTVLWFFLRELKRAEGEARLITKRRDDETGGLRFVAEGGKYRVRTHLTTRGLRGWAIYAGTLRSRDILPNELHLAELARENTKTGLDGNPASARP